MYYKSARYYKSTKESWMNTMMNFRYYLLRSMACDEVKICTYDFNAKSQNTVGTVRDAEISGIYSDTTVSINQCDGSTKSIRPVFEI